MSSTAKRNLFQMIALAILVVGGYAINGWIGALVGFGVFLVVMVVTTVFLMKKAGLEVGEKAKKDAEAAALAAESSPAASPEESEIEYKKVKAPTDHLKPKGQTRIKKSGAVQSLPETPETTPSE